MVLNLFIGVVVNAMQAEAVKAEAAEREAEREIMHEETAPMLAEIKSLRAEVAALPPEMRAGHAGGGCRASRRRMPGARPVHAASQLRRDLDGCAYGMPAPQRRADTSRSRSGNASTASGPAPGSSSRCAGRRAPSGRVSILS